MSAHTPAAQRADIAAAMNGGAFDPPADMSARAQQLWREAMAMHPGSFWKPAYLPFLRQYVEAVLNCERLDKEIAEQGETISSSKGGEYMHPLVQVRDRERAQMKSLARLLALTPDAVTHGSEADKRAQARAQGSAGRLVDAMNDSQGLIPGLETVQ